MEAGFSYHSYIGKVDRLRFMILLNNSIVGLQNLALKLFCKLK